MENLVEKIKQLRPTLPKQQRLLCDYICNHLFEASMLTIAELAEKAGVGTATVTRMVYSLGYTSYSQLKLDLRDEAVSNAKSSYGTYWDMYQKKTFNIADELNACQDMVQSMNTPLFISQIEIAANRILAARKIYILGLRTSAVSSMCLEYRLIDAGLSVFSLSRDPEFIFDRLIDMQKDDLLIAIASKPATKKTMDVLKICHKNKIPSLLITTASFPELESYASITVNTNTFDSLLAIVPPILAVELISCAVNRIQGNKHQDRYKRIEQLIDDTDINIWG